MAKIVLNKPILICLYGFPGSGKSFLARNLTQDIQTAHVSADRIRNELFAKPRYDAQENAIITHLMNYMTEEFLSAGVSVVYDANAMRINQRQRLRGLATNHKAVYLLVWLQIDIESAYMRTQRRDRRTFDDKYAQPQTRSTFNQQLADMQNPKDENYIVISGKHAFVTQKNAIVNRLYQIGIITSEMVQSNIIKPGLINLIPNPQAGRVDFSRRNISIT
ncbi:ATP-binding protein [Candidatus Saccharibacteria bacterium]|nr:ATP-binding protein [Candidatus Saccharibacteria bacterium]